jgi:outer membrane protein assembly factor BamB
MSDGDVKATLPATVWTAELGQNISQPPLIVGDVLLLATQPSGPAVQHGSLIALDLSNGMLRWEHNFEYALVSGLQPSRSVAERRELAIVSSSSSDFLQGEGSVQAFDGNGEILWQWQASEQNYSAPVIAGHQVYVTAGAQALVAVCPEDEGRCDEQRIKLAVKASLAAPVVHDGVAYIPCRSPDLLAVDLHGDVRWHFQLQGAKREWLDKTPVISNGQLFSASSLGSLLALDVSAGRMTWRTTIGEGRALSEPVIDGDRLYIGSRHGVSAVDKRNGTVLWSFATPRPVSAAPLVLDDTLYFTSEDHHLYALDVEQGEELWRHEMDRRIEMPPVLSPSVLVVADRGGHIVAFEAPAVPDIEASGEESADDPAVVIAFRKQTAEEYEQQDEPLDAARLWHELGDLERAAEQYEIADAWLEAADLWLQMDRYGKRAQALRKHARSVSKKDVTDDDKAAAWEMAARAYAETGQKEIRLQCEREVARYRKLPILRLDVEAEALAVDSWSKLNYTVHNEGFGIARHVDVTMKDDRFEAQQARTQTIITLREGDNFTHWIDVSPKSHGSSVPVHLAVEYVDKAGKIHVLDRTQYLPVAAATAPLSAASWAQTGGPGDTAGLLSQLPSPGGRSLPELREKLVQYFSRDELADVIFELGLLEDDFDEKISVMAKELILALARHGRLEELIEILKTKRSSVEW